MIMGMLSYKQTQRLWPWIAGAGALCYPAGAFAQNSMIFSTQSTIAEVVTWCLTAMNLLTWMLFGILTYLLDPRFMFGLTGNGQNTAFMDMLNEIWQLSRDISNIAFAVILVGAAVQMSVMAKKDYIAEHAKKFVLVVILVNFSWFIPRVVLDIANIATATIFGIPSLVGQNAGDACSYTSAYKGSECIDNGDGTFTCSCIVITNMKVFVDNWKQLDGTDGWSCVGQALFCYKSEKYTPGSVSNFSAVLNGLIINHGRLRELGQVPKSLKGSNKISELIVFVVRELILVVFHVALLFPLLAMTVAFLIRIPTLWITMAFMPFYCLGLILPDKIKEYTDGALDDILKNFIKAAFLPAIVAIPLSIGYIMINAGSKLPSSASQVKIALFPGITNLWELLWMCMSLGVLWVGVFKALSTAGGVIETSSSAIKSVGESTGMNALRSVPVPVPGGGGTVGGVWNKIKDNLKDGIGSNANVPKVPDTVRSGDTAKAAKKFAAGKDADVGKLTTAVKDLTKHINSGNKTEATKSLKDINDLSGSAVVGKKDAAADLQKLLDGMVKEKGGTPTSEMKDLKNAIDALKTKAPRANSFAFSPAPTGPLAEPFRLPTNLPPPATSSPIPGDSGMQVATIVPPAAPASPQGAIPAPPLNPLQNAPETAPGGPVVG